MKLTENELWILSFYRTSEISGSLFFGRLARSMRPGPVQCDMTKHFSDEALHAHYWTDCIRQFELEPFKLSQSYQDAYVSACGIPANIVEVLCITQIFEKRVINQYAKHMRVPGLKKPIVDTIERIMEDEKWHIQWVRDALITMEPRWGKDYIRETQVRFREADREVYQKTLEEHDERLGELFGDAKKVA